MFTRFLQNKKKPLSYKRTKTRGTTFFPVKASKINPQQALKKITAKITVFTYFISVKKLQSYLQDSPYRRFFSH